MWRLFSRFVLPLILLFPVSLLFLLCLKYLLVSLALPVYPHFLPVLDLSGRIIVLALLLGMLPLLFYQRNRRPKLHGIVALRIFQLTFFGLFTLPIAVEENIPWAPLFTVSTMIVFFLLFCLQRLSHSKMNKIHLFHRAQSLALLVSMILTAILYFTCIKVQEAPNYFGYGPMNTGWYFFIIIWMPLAIYLLWAILKRIQIRWVKSNRRWFRLPIMFNRFVLTFFLMIMLTSAFYSLQIPPQDSAIINVWPVKNLHNAMIDPVSDRLLVTQTMPDEKVISDHCQCFAFSLPDIWSGPQIYTVPTTELENFALDFNRREIYHVNRINPHTIKSLPLSTLLVLDADTFAVKRKVNIALKNFGSVNHALVPSKNKIFAHWERGYLLGIDQNTYEIKNAYPMRNEGDIIGDDRRGRVYIKYNNSNLLEARDAVHLTPTAQTKGPYGAENIAMSPERNELYLSAPFPGEIHVFSLPELFPIRTITTDLGQRALAVDAANNRLIAASYITGYIYIINLDTGKIIDRHYAAKFGRNLVTDPQRRRAFLTTARTGLYMMHY